MATCDVCSNTSRALFVSACGHGGCAVCVVGLLDKTCPVCGVPVSAVTTVWAAMPADLTDEERAAVARLRETQPKPPPTLDVGQRNRITEFKELFACPFPISTSNRERLIRLATDLAAELSLPPDWWTNATFSSSETYMRFSGVASRVAIVLDANFIKLFPFGIMEQQYANRAVDFGARLGQLPQQCRSPAICLFFLQKPDWTDHVGHIPLISVSREMIMLQLCRGVFPDGWDTTRLFYRCLVEHPEYVGQFRERLDTEDWIHLFVKGIMARDVAAYLPEFIRSDPDAMKTACVHDPHYFPLVDPSILAEVARDVLAYDPKHIFRIPLTLRTSEMWDQVKTATV